MIGEAFAAATPLTPLAALRSLSESGGNGPKRYALRPPPARSLARLASDANAPASPTKRSLGQAPRSGQAQTDETDQNRAEGRQAPPGEALVQEEHAEEGTEQHGGLAGSHNITHRS